MQVPKILHRILGGSQTPWSPSEDLKLPRRETVNPHVYYSLKADTRHVFKIKSHATNKGEDVKSLLKLYKISKLELETEAHQSIQMDNDLKKNTPI